MEPEDRSSAPTAIVVGANFAGLAAAIALRRAGVAATAYERAPGLDRLQGARGGVHIWPNALRALDLLGAADAVKASGVEFKASAMLTTDGKMLTNWPLEEMHRELGQPTLLVQRTDLHRALAETLAGLAPDAVRTGMRCTGFEQDAGGVTARFENGEEARADILVGADGMKSAIRAQLLGPTEFRPSGGPMVRGDATLAADAVAMPLRTTHIYLGRGYQFGLNRIDEERFSWFLRTAPGSDVPADPAAVATLVRGWAEPVVRVVAATTAEQTTRVELYDAKPSSKWGEGRVTLAGDAAHPMLNALSQGAAQAFEDGAVLNLVLSERGTADLPGALRAYEERRIARAASYVNRSRFIGDMAVWRNPVACVARTAFMRLAGGAVWKRMRQSTGAAF
jgi:2-polyprenyl-6-methoxyphenol hydroxylase-like FAD-dependent oxidoreductase